MKRTLIVFFIVLATASVVFGQAKAKKAANDRREDERQIKALVRQTRDALMRKELTTLDRIMDDDFVNSGARGDRLLTKAELLAHLKDADVTVTPYTYTVEDERVRFYGDTAIATGLVIIDAQKEGQPAERLRFTTVYVKRRTGWRSVASHTSGLPPEE